MNIVKRWKNWQSKFYDERLPVQKKIRFNHKNLFVFPTPKGGLFLVTALVIFVAGTNYHNPLMVMFAWFMISILLASVGYTFANLSGLEIRCLGAEPTYAGQMIVFRFHVSVPNTSRNGFRPKIHIMTDDKKGGDQKLVDGHAVLNLGLKTLYRGWFTVPRIRIQTTYPLGLIQAWSYPHCLGGSWVYPSPIVPKLETEGRGMSDEGVHPSKDLGDEFDQITPYQFGDNLSRIHWKSLAQGKGLNSKRFNKPAASNVWIDWEDYPSTEPEERLRWLCYRVRLMSATDQPYGLRLPTAQRSPDSSSSHRAQCLLMLAQYGRQPIPTAFTEDISE